MSFLFRKTAVAPAFVSPAAAPPAILPPTKNVIQLLDECVMHDTQMPGCTQWGHALTQLMTVDRVKKLSTDEYAHLLVIIGYMFKQRERYDRFDQIDAVWMVLATHATRHILNEKLHEYISAWSSGAYSQICLMLLIAVATHRARVPHVDQVVDVLCRHIGPDIVSVTSIASAQWTVLFSLLSVRQALYLLDKRKGLYVLGPDDLLRYFDERLEKGPIDKTIDALIEFPHLWTTTADATLSPLGVKIWQWLCTHPTASCVFDVCLDNCHAPLDGWLLVRTHHLRQKQQEQLPQLVGHWHEILNHLDTWVRDEPSILVDIVSIVTTSFVGSLGATAVLVQAWPFIDEALQMKVVNRSVSHGLVAPSDALRMALLFDTLVLPHGPIPKPLDILLHHVLDGASSHIATALSSLSLSHFFDGHPSIYRMLVIVHRMNRYQELSAQLAIRCTETQLCQLSSIDAQDRSHLYVGMLRLVPQPVDYPTGLSYVNFSTHARRACRLHFILTRLAQQEGWADFVETADSNTRLLLATRKQTLEQVCHVHLFDDLARLCMEYI
jgi:hypothetical protein